MRRKVIQRFSVIDILLLMSTAFLVFIPYKQAIVISYEDEQQLLAYVPLKKDETFQIKYTHSIHLSDVVESYRLSSVDLSGSCVHIIKIYRTKNMG